MLPLYLGNELFPGLAERLITQKWQQLVLQALAFEVPCLAQKWVGDPDPPLKYLGI